MTRGPWQGETLKEEQEKTLTLEAKVDDLSCMCAEVPPLSLGIIL